MINDNGINSRNPNPEFYEHSKLLCLEEYNKQCLQRR